MPGEPLDNSWQILYAAPQLTPRREEGEEPHPGQRACAQANADEPTAARLAR
ncbi:MAG TPA: hypothetical protein VKR06_25235 [Ktedonosporobacter sp.]|nr:hypothetical protein [Ktedonosporobacter sp.]